MQCRHRAIPVQLPLPPHSRCRLHAVFALDIHSQRARVPHQPPPPQLIALDVELLVVPAIPHPELKVVLVVPRLHRVLIHFLIIEERPPHHLRLKNLALVARLALFRRRVIELTEWYFIIFTVAHQTPRLIIVHKRPLDRRARQAHTPVIVFRCIRAHAVVIFESERTVRIIPPLFHASTKLSSFHTTNDLCIAEGKFRCHVRWHVDTNFHTLRLVQVDSTWCTTIVFWQDRKLIF